MQITAGNPSLQKTLHKLTLAYMTEPVTVTVMHASWTCRSAAETPSHDSTGVHDSLRLVIDGAQGETQTMPFGVEF